VSPLRGSLAQPTRPSERAHQAPRRLADYVCYNAQSKDPPSTTSFQQGSSDTLYPIVKFVTCNFSPSYQNFVAVITNIVEPRYYHEAAKDPLWQKAMVEEIQALEENKT